MNKPKPKYQNPHGDVSGGCGEHGAMTPRSNATMGRAPVAGEKKRKDSGRKESGY